MADTTTDSARFELDGRPVNQIRYAVTLTPPQVTQDPALHKKSGPQQGTIESAELRFFKGRKEIAAFGGLTAADVEALVGKENRIRMEQGLGAAKRNQPANGRAGSLKEEHLAPAETSSMDLQGKAISPKSTKADVVASTHAPVLDQRAVEIGDRPQIQQYVLKHYNEFGSVMDAQSDLRSAIESFDKVDIKNVPQLLQGDRVVMEVDIEDNRTLIYDDTVKAAYARFWKEAMEQSRAEARTAPTHAAAAPHVSQTPELSNDEREALSALVVRMQAEIENAKPRSFIQTSAWVAKDADTWDKVNAENKHLATMVMAAAARRDPDYRAALSRKHPTAAIAVENDIHASELEEKLAQPKREPAARRSTPSTQSRNSIPGNEANSVEHDDERVVESATKVTAVAPATHLRESVGKQVDLGAMRRDKGSAQPAVTVTNDEKPQGPRIPKAIEDAYLRVGNNFHYMQKPSLRAFEDKGTKLETKSNSARIAADFVKIASAREWERIKVKGSDEFRQKVWLEASLQGIAVRGYKPTEADLALLAKRDLKTAANAVDLDASARERAPLARAQEDKGPTAEIPTGKAENTKLAGILLEHGRARYNFDPDEKMSYYVKFRDADDQEHTSWGKDLAYAMVESKAEIGQYIELKKIGKHPVTVEANVRDTNGKVIGKTNVDTHLNKWEVKAEAFRTQDPKDAVKQHPELVGAYAVMRAAQELAADRFASRKDQERFMSLTRETLAKQMVQRQAIPEVRVRGQEHISHTPVGPSKERNLER